MKNAKVIDWESREIYRVSHFQVSEIIDTPDIVKRTDSDGRTVYDIYRYGISLPYMTVLLD